MRASQEAPKDLVSELQEENTHNKLMTILLGPFL